MRIQEILGGVLEQDSLDDLELLLTDKFYELGVKMKAGKKAEADEKYRALENLVADKDDGQELLNWMADYESELQEDFYLTGIRDGIRSGQWFASITNADKDGFMTTATEIIAEHENRMNNILDELDITVDGLMEKGRFALLRLMELTDKKQDEMREFASVQEELNMFVNIAFDYFYQAQNTIGDIVMREKKRQEDDEK